MFVGICVGQIVGTLEGSKTNGVDVEVVRI